MKVLMIHTFLHERGGDTTYTLALSGLLREAGHVVIPFGMRHPDNLPSPWAPRFMPTIDLSDGGGHLGPRASRLFWSPRAARAVRSLVRELRPDIAHVQHLHRYLSPSVLWPLRDAGVPIVWTAHDYELICPEGHLFSQGRPCEACRGHRYEQAVLRHCKRGRVGPSAIVALEKSLHRWLGVWDRVDRFLCPSQFMADALVRFGLPAGRVFHQPNFVRVSEAPSEDAGEGWVFAGRLAPEKGLDTVVELARTHPGLTVCGGGPEQDRLRARLPGASVRGRLDRRALDAVLRAARVVVVPSRWPENFPYAVLEAQVHGRAVIASDIGGIPEQITHDHDGLLVAPRDLHAWSEALGGLLSDPGRARGLGAEGARRVRRTLSPAAHLHAIEAHYRAAISGRRG